MATFAHEMDALIDQLQDQGWRVVRRGRTSRPVAMSPDGETQVALGLKRGDYRSMRNTMKQLERGGFRPVESGGRGPSS